MASVEQAVAERQARMAAFEALEKLAEQREG